MGRVSFSTCLYAVSPLAFVNFGFLESDLSIFFLAFCCLLSLARLCRSVPVRELFHLSVTVGIIFLVWILTGSSALLKLAASALLISTICLVTQGQISPSLQRFVGAVWLLAALATFFNPTIFDDLFYRVGRDARRGATGLTSEPSLLGIYSSFYLAIALRQFTVEKPILSEKSKRCLVAASVFFGLSVLLSLSLFGVIILMLVLLSLRFYFIGFISACLASLVILLMFPGTRIAILLQLILDLDFQSLASDRSILFRINSFNALTSGGNWQEGIGQAAGFSALFANLPTVVALCVVLSLIGLFPFRHAWLAGARSIEFLFVVVIFFFVGPLAVVPFWIYVAREWNYVSRRRSHANRTG